MHKAVLLFVIILLAYSCRKLVQDDFANPTLKPVVNALIRAGRQAEIQLSYPANIASSRIDYIENANVQLFENGVFIEELAYEKAGVYRSNYTLNEKNNYECEIVIPEYKVIKCSTYIPSKPLVYDVEHVNQAGINEEGISFPAVKVTFSVDTTLLEYYQAAITLFNIEEITTPELEEITDKAIINEGLPIPLFSNEIIHDTVYQLTLNYSTGLTYSSGDGIWHTGLYPLIVEFRRVSEAYYNYAKSLYLYTEGYCGNSIGNNIGNFNTYSNIANGYGIFAGYSDFISDTIYPNSAGHE